jgi:hypothetical protein
MEGSCPKIDHPPAPHVACQVDCGMRELLARVLVPHYTSGVVARVAVPAGDVESLTLRSCR